MRYGLFQLDTTESPVAVRAEPAATVLPQVSVKRPLVRKKRLSSSARSTRADLCFSRDTIGTPFRILPVITPRQSGPSPHAKGDRYRELVTKANLAMDPLSLDKLSIARSSAADSFVTPIQREMEEARRFLDNLTISGPPPAQPASQKFISSESLDDEIKSALKQVADMRNEHRQKLVQMEKEKEERRKQEEERKEQEKKEKEEAAAAAASGEPEKASLKPKTKPVVKPALPAQPTVQPSAPVSVPAKATGSSIANASTRAAEEWASKYRDMYVHLMDSIAPTIKNDKAKKDFCFKNRGIIVRSFGQLKDSQEFVNRIADTVVKIVAESPPGVEQWMLNLVAKAIVKQAEKEVSVAHHAAFPLAAATVLVMRRFPQLADMLLVRLVKKCPYIIPEYAGRKQGQSAEAYLRSIGYKEKDDDELETEGIYVERMAGMVALFAAIVQTTEVSGVAEAQKHPLSIHLGWTWLARIVNLRPRTISPLLVHTFLSIAGPSMMGAYGNQFRKLLDILASEWLADIKLSKDPVAVAATSNLSGFLDGYKKTGAFKECSGRFIKPR
ncbi:hypothetical protein LPJ72_003661 [Coemansia sp. Benny D160-2]|nr:hypothetical protein LPJ72_003661 [Coemansia sp. Benny D160-2]